jgi:antitoxin component HigA of HigAB toxin-antitoxin module
MALTLASNSNDAYLKLVQSFPLRPIRTRTAHRHAKQMFRSLIGKRGAAVLDYKTVLVSLIAEYESSANLKLDTSDVTPADVITHVLEERGMSANALAKVLGISQSSLSEMLNGRRDWSKSAIVGISNYFGLQPGLFLK